jgi:hypothetical protein
MKRRLNSIITGLSNIWKWRKVIYRDRDWDYWFIYEILKTKLQYQSEHFIKYGYHENSSKDAKQMLECIDLIDKVQNEYYEEQALESEVWDEKEMKAAQDKHNEARKKLFKLLEENIERWWD